MLDLGFKGDVVAVSGQVRPERQSLFFSATWSREVQELTNGLCHQGIMPVRISEGRQGASGEPAASVARAGIVQEVVVLDYPDNAERQSAEKQRLLEEHLHHTRAASEDHKVLVFVATKAFANTLANRLCEAGFAAAAIHGGKSQDDRLWALDQFRMGALVVFSFFFCFFCCCFF
ncbi:unnamed protein product [Polarella glacialis]|uniref:Helicase C-terminal domain-containing protein n=1 Tax=Polarella glacialis TaxID=89957 RepID=A0A813FB49_POLGL|nr:unnamed protein product [Polarella glacialis]